MNLGILDAELAGNFTGSFGAIDSEDSMVGDFLNRLGKVKILGK